MFLNYVQLLNNETNKKEVFYTDTIFIMIKYDEAAAYIW